jgi:4-hydroxy-tetrahydrodipicolinate synthase
MSGAAPLRGCIPIVVTPFLADETIDEESLRAQVEWLIGEGVHGLATPAIASEGYKLDEAERERVVAIVVEQSAGRLPVVVSADGNGLLPAVRRAVRAQQLGADALMVLPPMFIKPDAAALTRYYLRIAAAVDLPIMVQDAPQLTGVPMPASWLAQLARDCPAISSVKIEGTPAGEKTTQLLALSEGRMDVFAGWGGLSFWEGLVRGAAGCMPAPNFGPALARVDELFHAGEVDLARSLFLAHAPFIAWSMQSVDLSIWTAKQALVQRGILRTATLREPATQPDAILRAECAAYSAETE